MSPYVSADAINFFLCSYSKEPIMIIKNRWHAKLYNSESNIDFPNYNKNDFAIWDCNMTSLSKEFINVISNPETLIIALDILKDALKELGVLCFKTL